MRVFHRDLVTGDLFTTGSNVVIQLPGEGVAIIGAGRLVFDVQGGLVEHNGPDTDRGLAERCAALAG
jgi:hypothetical protein